MHNIARRRFLKFLAASPLLSAPGLASSLFAQDELIASPDLALDVFDFEAVARHRLPPAHFGYMATGVDDDATLRANREGFGRYQLRVRRLVDLQRDGHVGHAVRDDVGFADCPVARQQSARVARRRGARVGTGGTGQEASPTAFDRDVDRRGSGDRGPW